MDKEQILSFAKHVAKERAGTDDFDKLSNKQLIEVIAEALEYASMNPDIDVIAKGLKRLARNRNDSLGI